VPDEINDAGDVFPFLRNEDGRVGAFDVFPPLRSGHVGAIGGFGGDHSFQARGSGAAGRCAELAPDAVFGDEHLASECFRSCHCSSDLSLKSRGTSVAPRKKNRIGGNQPLGLIGHNDGDAVAGADAHVLQCFGERQGFVLEIAVGEALLFFAAVGFDQADFGWATSPKRRGALRRRNYIFLNQASEAGLDALGECFEVADALNFIVGEFDAEMIFQAGEHFEGLQAVDAELLVEIVVGRKGACGDFELHGSELKDLLRGLFDGAHTHSIYHPPGGKENSRTEPEDTKEAGGMQPLQED